MLGRICMLAAICVALALSAVLQPEQADARSSVAATAAHHCGRIAAATRHRSPSVRALSSAEESKAQHLCGEANGNISTIRFWMNPKRQWTLYPRHLGDTCWDLRRKNLLQGPEALCSVARGAVRVSTRHLARLDAKIKAFLPKVQPWVNLLAETYTMRQCIITGESRYSGLYKAENGGTRYVEGGGHSNASGAYQFLDSTWQIRFAQAKGMFRWLSGNWSHAADAPSLVQDVVAGYVVKYHAATDWTECH